MIITSIAMISSDQIGYTETNAMWVRMLKTQRMTPSA